MRASECGGATHRDLRIQGGDSASHGAVAAGTGRKACREGRHIGSARILLTHGVCRSGRAQDCLRAGGFGATSGPCPRRGRGQPYLATAARRAGRRVHRCGLGRARGRPVLGPARENDPGGLRGRACSARRVAAARARARGRPVLGRHRDAGAVPPPPRARCDADHDRHLRRLEGVATRGRGARSGCGRPPDAGRTAGGLRAHPPGTLRRRAPPPSGASLASWPRRT